MHLKMSCWNGHTHDARPRTQPEWVVGVDPYLVTRVAWNHWLEEMQRIVPVSNMQHPCCMLTLEK